MHIELDATDCRKPVVKERHDAFVIVPTDSRHETAVTQLEYRASGKTKAEALGFILETLNDHRECLRRRLENLDTTARNVEAELARG